MSSTHFSHQSQGEGPPDTSDPLGSLQPPLSSQTANRIITPRHRLPEYGSDFAVQASRISHSLASDTFENFGVMGGIDDTDATIEAVREKTHVQNLLHHGNPAMEKLLDQYFDFACQMVGITSWNATSYCLGGSNANKLARVVTAYNQLLVERDVSDNHTLKTTELKRTKILCASTAHKSFSKPIDDHWHENTIVVPVRYSETECRNYLLSEYIEPHLADLHTIVLTTETHGIPQFLEQHIFDYCEEHGIKIILDFCAATYHWHLPRKSTFPGDNSPILVQNHKDLLAQKSVRVVTIDPAKFCGPYEGAAVVIRHSEEDPLMMKAVEEKFNFYNSDYFRSSGSADTTTANALGAAVLTKLVKSRGRKGLMFYAHQAKFTANAIANILSKRGFDLLPVFINSFVITFPNTQAMEKAYQRLYENGVATTKDIERIVLNAGESDEIPRRYGIRFVIPPNEVMLKEKFDFLIHKICESIPLSSKEKAQVTPTEQYYRQCSDYYIRQSLLAGVSCFYSLTAEHSLKYEHARTALEELGKDERFELANSANALLYHFKKFFVHNPENHIHKRAKLIFGRRVRMLRHAAEKILEQDTLPSPAKLLNVKNWCEHMIAFADTYLDFLDNYLARKTPDPHAYLDTLSVHVIEAFDIHFTNFINKEQRALISDVCTRHLSGHNEQESEIF